MPTFCRDSMGAAAAVREKKGRFANTKVRAEEDSTGADGKGSGSGSTCIEWNPDYWFSAVASFKSISCCDAC